jgi:hypothetical protein
VTPEVALTAARNTGRPVVVILDDGRRLTGVIERITYEGTFRANGRDFPTSALVEVRAA